MEFLSEQDTKMCGSCKIVKNVSEFHKNKNTYDGLGYKCKACHKEYSKIHYMANRDKYIEGSMKRYYKNKETINDEQ